MTNANTVNKVEWTQEKPTTPGYYWVAIPGHRWTPKKEAGEWKMNVYEVLKHDSNELYCRAGSHVYPLNAIGDSVFWSSTTPPPPPSPLIAGSGC